MIQNESSYLVAVRAISLSLILLAGGNVEGQSQLALADPEGIAGRWEASDGMSGAIGLNIALTTRMIRAGDGTPKVAELLEGVTVATYHRTGSQLDPLGFNYFTSESGSANWDGRRLKVISAGRAVHVDLIWSKESQTFSGIFEQGDSRRTALLKRPAVSNVSRLVGTWFDAHGLMNNCLHLAQQEDGAFAAWSDDVLMPGRIAYSNTPEPVSTHEHYGEMAIVNMDASGQITAKLRAYTAGCCSHTFAGKLSGDGTLLLGRWIAGLNQTDRAVEWKKVQGTSCLSSASH